MPSRARIALRTVAAAAAVCAALALLHWVAKWRFDAHLRNEAAHALAQSAAAQSPWRWHFHKDDDLVAGRVFDAAAFSFRDGELIATSAGHPFEIGLPLPHAIDLRRFPHLRITAIADTAANIAIVARPTLTAPELAMPGAQLNVGADACEFDLSAPAWTMNAAPVVAPSTAAMLRLRVDLPARGILRLRSVDLLRVDGAQAVDLHDMAAVHALDAEVSMTALASLDARIDVRHTPLLVLPQGLRIEKQRLLLDAIDATLPAAIVIPGGHVAAAFAEARALAAEPAPAASPGRTRWIIALVFALVLLGARIRPPGGLRVRALAEIVLVLAVPLWLIVGGHFTGKPDAPQLLAIAATAIYALSLGWPRDWRWNGSARAWWLAGLVVLVAIAVGTIAHGGNVPLRKPGAGPVLRYFAWALLQQYLVCVVCTRRWQQISGNACVAAVLGALGFALMHSPNADLMFATFLGGLCWCALYLRERALLPLAASHALCALILIALTPPQWLYSAEVSARFFQ